MHRALKPSLAIVGLCALACYHATVETGLKPSAQTVEKSFAASWIYGLVPPSTIETAGKCPHGAAKVETQLSFVNMLVGAITAGIYTPMAIKVTCAESGRASRAATGPAIDLGANPTSEQVRDAIARAAEQSLEDGRPVFVEY